MNRNRRIALGLSIAAVAGSALYAFESRAEPMTRAYAAAADSSADARARINSSADLEHAFERVADVLKPSVVSITSTRELEGASLQDVPDELQRFFEFHGRAPQSRNRAPQLEQAPRERGVGSGVIISADGYIVTNNHVVESSSDLRVFTSDEREHVAKVIGTDPRTDLALIKIDASGLTAAQWGDSDGLKVGQWVAAFGTPFGLEQTMSSGIVSAKGRANLHITDYEDFIQTDAAINPGNSGGPLVDLSGNVIGISSAIVSRSGGNQGIGLAIPSNMARDIAERLMRDGHVVRGWLGVAIQELTPSLARSFNDGESHGVLVGDVTADSPAQRAGMQAGDVIEELDGRAVDNVQHLRSQIADLAPGAKASFSVRRDGKQRTLSVEIGKAPDSANEPAANEPTRSGFGLQLVNTSPRVEQELSLPANTHGAVVAAVTPGSVAEDAGLVPGDVIVEVQRTAVKNADEAVAELRKHSNEGVLVRVMRDGTTSWIQLDAPRQN